MDEDIKIKMRVTVRPEFASYFRMGPDTILKAGKEYPAISNIYGAVTGICDNGEPIGVKPGEFEFIEAPEWLLKIHSNYGGK